MQKQNMSNYLKFKTMWKAEVVVSQGKGTPGKEYLSCLEIMTEGRQLIFGTGHKKLYVLSRVVNKRQEEG